MKKVLMFILVLFVASCDNEALFESWGTHTSEGWVLGNEGSVSWEAKAPQRDVMAYYTEKSIPELCSSWRRSMELESAYRERRRQNISEALWTKGRDYNYCSGENYDQQYIHNQELRRERGRTNAARQEASREREKAHRAKREADYNRNMRQLEEIQRQRSISGTPPAECAFDVNGNMICN